MTRDGIMREGIGVVAMVVMAVHIVEETPHMLTQGIIEDQEPVSLRTAYLLGLLEEIDEPTVIDAVLEPRRFREEAGEVGFVSTLEHTAGDVRQAFVVQDDQTCQVILEMLKLAPILEEVPEDICMSGHEGSRGHDRKLHQALPFHVGGGIGPESITRKSEMANHNSRVILLLGLRLARALKGAERTMLIQNDGRGLRRGTRCPCLERFKERHEVSGTIFQFDGMRCAVHGNESSSH